jgi:hypothetical protein
MTVSIERMEVIESEKEGESDGECSGGRYHWRLNECSLHGDSDTFEDGEKTGTSNR